MNKEVLVIKLAEEFGVSTIDIYHFVNTVFDSIQKALAKGKNVNISEFGKFILINKRNEAGESYKTIAFSPVRKFAAEINFRYNDLSPTPLKTASLTSEEEKEEVILEEDLQSRREAFENLNSENINLSENINTTIMSDKDKHDEDLIRDEFPEDSSMESIEAFIQSKLKSKESPISGESTGLQSNKEEGIKEFELPHTIIELHKDITSEGEFEQNLENKSADGSNIEIDKELEQMKKQIEEFDSTKENVSRTEPEFFKETGFEITQDEDLGKIIEERKKILEQISPEFHHESQEEEVSKQEDHVHRESIEEMRDHFEDEKNAELSKIIAERNKIISDINSLVNDTHDISYEEEKIKEEKYREPIVEKIPEYKEKENRQSDSDAENYFDPIVTQEEEESDDKPISRDEDLSGNDILIPEDVEKLKESIEKPMEKKPTPPEKEPKSFEDVFETKSEVTASETGNITPKEESKQPEYSASVNKPETPVRTTGQAPDTKKGIPPVAEESYRDRMQRRREMYEKREGKSAKKAIWIVTTLVIVIIVIGFLYNMNNNNTTPPQQNENNTQQDANTPPVESKQPAENKTPASEQDQAQNKEQAPPPTTPSGEEFIVDNTLNVVFIRTADGFYIQTGSYKNKADADRKAAQTSAGNKEVIVKSAEVEGKGTYYRVRIGKFSSQEEAKEFAAKLK